MEKNMEPLSENMGKQCVDRWWWAMVRWRNKKYNPPQKVQYFYLPYWIWVLWESAPKHWDVTLKATCFAIFRMGLLRLGLLCDCVVILSHPKLQRWNYCNLQMNIKAAAICPGAALLWFWKRFHVPRSLEHSTRCFPNLMWSAGTETSLKSNHASKSETWIYKHGRCKCSISMFAEIWQPHVRLGSAPCLLWRWCCWAKKVKQRSFLPRSRVVCYTYAYIYIYSIYIYISCSTYSKLFWRVFKSNIQLHIPVVSLVYRFACVSPYRRKSNNLWTHHATLGRL